MATVLDTTPDAPLPDHYEVVNGAIVEVPPMSSFSSEVANRIRDELALYGHSSRSGRARSDMLFRVPFPADPTRNREPDAAFISYERWPENRPMPYRGNPTDVVPDLTVEVASPTDTVEDFLAKAHEYLPAGVRLVWVVYPRLHQLHAHTSPTAPPRVFTDADTLDGGDVLPGFSVPMAGLFPVLSEETDSGGDE
jgi:Uma2 family endonuclease